MDNREYKPAPIATDGIELEDDLRELTETLARNVHEIWAEHRMAEGWRYGEIKDAGAKRTDMLVPFEELTEEERELDRKHIVGTLKALYALGYRITKQ